MDYYADMDSYTVDSTDPAAAGGAGTSYDTNADGYIDEIHYDTNANGYIDEIYYDTNADGMADAVSIDSNADGIIDIVGEDTDHDGTADTVQADTDYDGIADVTDVTNAATTETTAALSPENAALAQIHPAAAQTAQLISNITNASPEQLTQLNGQVAGMNAAAEVSNSVGEWQQDLNDSNAAHQAIIDANGTETYGQSVYNSGEYLLG